MTRKGRIERGTKETQVLVEIDLDGTGQVDVATGVGFFDHMLAQLGKHGSFDLTVKTSGDLHIDSHHTIEDTSIALGQAFREALGDKAADPPLRRRVHPAGRGARAGHRGRLRPPYLVHVEPDGMAPMIGPEYDTTMTRHIFESFVSNARVALHVHVPYGRNAHHIVEAQFKASPARCATRWRSTRRCTASRPPRGPVAVEIGDAHLTYGNIVVFAVGVFLLAGVYSFIKQGIKFGALILLVLAGLAFAGE